MFKKLKKRLLLTIMLAVLLILVTMCTVVYAMTYRSLSQEGEVALTRALDYARNPNSKFYSESRRQIGLPYFTMDIDENGRSFYIDAHGMTMNDVPDPGGMQKILTGVDDEGTVRAWGLRYMREPIARGSRVAVINISVQQATLSALARQLLTVSAAALLLFFFLGLLFACWGTGMTEKAFEQQRRFISNASHDLKTPITIIMMNAEMLEMKLHERQHNLELIHSEAVRMKKMTNQLLEMARLDMSKLPMRPERINLSDVLTESVLSFEIPLHQKGLRLQQDIQPGLMLRGDEERLRELMDILIDNAYKYSAPGNEVAVTLRAMPLSRVRLAVHNTGSYISRSECKHVFDRFYRCDPTRTETEGTGLGLSIAKSIVQAHRGRISVRSDEALGTEFEVLFFGHKAQKA